MSEKLKVLVSKSEARRLSFSKDKIQADILKLENKQNRTAEENNKLQRLKDIIHDIRVTVT